MKAGPLIDALRAQGLSDEDLALGLELHRTAGGTLDTALLEAGLPEAVVSRALGEAAGMPVVSPSRLTWADPEALAMLPRDLVARYGAVPFAAGHDAVAVATMGPLAEQDRRALEAFIGRPLRFHVASELRLRSAMARHYGLPLSERLGRLLERLGGAPSGEEGPQREVAAARERLFAARERDEAIDLLLRFGRSRFEYVGVFALREGHLTGHDALGRDRATDRAAIRRIRISTAWQSLFRRVLETGAHMLGPVPDTELDALIVSDLGRQRPTSVLVIPVYVRERPALIVYADNGRQKIEAEAASDLLVLASALPRVLERIILERKARQRRPGASRPESPAGET
ncbi:MAG: hypothetical protein D6729_16390, partial [Deltaproteobacteria bacterium]